MCSRNKHKHTHTYALAHVYRNNAIIYIPFCFHFTGRIAHLLIILTVHNELQIQRLLRPVK